MVTRISDLPVFIQNEIRNTQKTIKGIFTHDYANYTEVLVEGVDDAGWGFCRILTYPKPELE